jgi:FtsH-binding integral membrane protein
MKDVSTQSGEPCMNEYAQQLTVAQSNPSERAAFIRRTYAHLAGAILAFIGLEAYMIHSPVAEMLLQLFASVALLFWYVLRILMSLNWR